MVPPGACVHARMGLLLGMSLLPALTCTCAGLFAMRTPLPVRHSHPQAAGGTLPKEYWALSNLELLRLGSLKSVTGTVSWRPPASFYQCVCTYGECV